MEINLKEEFEVVEDGCVYSLPVYTVKEGKGIVQDEKDHQQIRFVRGSKLGSEKVEKRTGTLHEHLLAAMIHDLKLKNSLVPSRDGEKTIEKMEEALHWLRQRQIDRSKRQVLGTYQK